MASVEDKQRRVRLEAEQGTIFKGWNNRVRVALVYPNLYTVAMANLGFQTVYQRLNAMAHVVCERVFLPDPEDGDNAVRSLESGRPLHDFDCVAFSLSFENDYLNVLTILQKAALPLRSANRGFSLPLIIAGGVAVFLNPEPLAPFFDCFLVGEAEAALVPFFDRFQPGRDRRATLLELAREVPGVYVPRFFRPQYNPDGTLLRFSPIEAVPRKVRRVYADRMDTFATDTVVVTRQTSFEDAYLIEVSRGCPHGCRFCAAGFIYRPPRIRSLPELLHSMETGAAVTRKIGLVGTAVSDLPALKALCAQGLEKDLQLSFSSLRADALDSELIAALKAGRLKTATIAPEVGSIRMRTVINKGLSEDAILSAAENLVAGGIPNLKLYFMVGLPTERDEDIHAIVALVKQIKDRFLGASQVRGRMGAITVSLNCFVPKPFTPFQWAAMDSPGELKRKIKTVRTGLKKIPNVRLNADMPRRAHLQALFSRGDRRVADLLRMAHRNNGNWPQTLKATVLDPGFFVLREREEGECFPWDFIDHGIDKSFLWNEHQRAMQGKPTKACPMEPANCKLCGVCRP